MSETELKKSTLLIATLSSFMTPFMGSSINIALPSLGEDLEINAVLLSWVATSYLLATAVSLVPFGKLADIYGRKRIYLYGIVGFTLTSILSALSISAPMLIACRALHGIAGSMIFATGIAILTSVFPPNERGKALGINVAAVYAGLSLGPLLGGFLTEHLTWRSVFLVNVPFGLVIIGLVKCKLKGEWAEARGDSFDLQGALIYGLALVSVMYGISLLPAARSYAFVLLGVLAGGMFVRREARVETPVFDLSLFRTNRVFAFSNLAALIHYSATFAVTFFLSLYLQYVKGLSPQSAGLILIAQPLVMSVLSPLAGRLSDRFEPRLIASAGMALTMIGLILLVSLDRDSRLTCIIADLVLIGFGYALFSSPNTNAIMGSVERRFYGLASGAVSTMRVLGMMISMGMATLVLAVYMGDVRLTAESLPRFVEGVRTAFILFSLLCFLGIFSSLARGRLR